MKILNEYTIPCTTIPDGHFIEFELDDNEQIEYDTIFGNGNKKKFLCEYQIINNIIYDNYYQILENYYGERLKTCWDTQKFLKEINIKINRYKKLIRIIE